MDLNFVKMNGAGNDFVMVEDLDERWAFEPNAIAWLCDRHFGIGADGLILVRKSRVEDADYFMLYYNADGTTAEMCGNGIRCFTKYLVDYGILPAGATSVRVDTLGGVKPITFKRADDGTMCEATVDMGEPVLTPSEVPTKLQGIADQPIETELGTFSVTTVSMGNPHAIIWVDDVEDAPVEEVGPLVEENAAFPAKTNVEFAHVLDDDRIDLRVWERGVGETLACGTGACATLVAAALATKTGRAATVELPGGELFIHWAENGRVYMTGSATVSFEGVVRMDDLPA